MAGFKPARTVYRLHFEDDDLEGLIVRARSLPTGDFLAITELAELVDGLDAAGQRDMFPKVRQLFAAFGAALVEWNVLDDDDRPVPATPAGMEAQEFGLNLRIIQAWIEAVAGASTPLGQPSSSGGTPEGLGSLPMEPLSSSRAS